MSGRHLLRRRHQGRRTHLPANLCRYILQVGRRQTLHNPNAITGASLLNDRVLPFFSSLEMGLIRMLTGRDTEYGKLKQHDYELYLGINGIEHTKTNARHPQTNGICELFHKTVFQEFYQVVFRRYTVSLFEGIAGRLDKQKQLRADSSRQNVLRQNVHANIP